MSAVHNHRPYRPVCPERMTPDGLKGTCMNGSTEIATERQRQIDTEGRTPEHDAHHPVSALIAAANAYLISSDPTKTVIHAASFWPWEQRTFKPTTARRDLVKAGALIAAAIDRLDGEAQR